MGKSWKSRKMEIIIDYIISHKNLTSIDLSNTQLRHIPNFAFTNYENIQTILLPNSLTSINTSAFYNNISLKAIDLLNTKVTDIHNSVFAYCKKLTTIKLPSTLKVIGSSGFYHCNSLYSINLSDTNLTTIGSEAFIIVIN